MLIAEIFTGEEFQYFKDYVSNFNCYKSLVPRKKFCHLSIFENVVLFDFLGALGKFKKGGDFYLEINELC